MRKIWTDGLVNVSGDVDGDLVNNLSVSIVGKEENDLDNLSNLQVAYYSHNLKEEGVNND